MNIYVHDDTSIVLDLVTAVEVTGSDNVGATPMFTVNVWSVGGAVRSFPFYGPRAEPEARALRDGIVAALKSIASTMTLWVAQR
jgi:hypothetical protein